MAAAASDIKSVSTEGRRERGNAGVCSFSQESRKSPEAPGRLYLGAVLAERGSVTANTEPVNHCAGGGRGRRRWE